MKKRERMDKGMSRKQAPITGNIDYGVYIRRLWFEDQIELPLPKGIPSLFIRFLRVLESSPEFARLTHVR